MKLLGFASTALGFLAGAYYLTGAGGSVLGLRFWSSFIIALAGVVTLRVATRKTRAAEEKVSAEVITARDSLSRLVQGVGELEEVKDEVDVYDLSREINDRFDQDLERFVEARESIAIAYGLPAYAAVMSHFAAGERYLNRVWSCSVDGYIDEAHAYLTRAREQFAEGYARLTEYA